MKSLVSSKTFWLAAAQFVVGFIALVTTYFGAYVPASILGIIVMVKSIIDVYVRTQTTTAIASVV